MYLLLLCLLALCRLAWLDRSAMLLLLKETWEEVQPLLKKEVGDAAYSSWLAHLRPIALERGVCHLQAENRFVCDRVQQLYLSVIEDALSEKLGTRISISLISQSESLLPDHLEVGPSKPVVDTSNRQVALVLAALLEGRALPSGLFFFHGPAGVGKTFLLKWWKDECRGPLLWFGEDLLLKAMQACLRDGRLDGFRDELLADKPLVIDQIHRISRHRRLQRELLAILRRREELKSPTILVSRWHPQEIWGLDPSLRTHFLSGFVSQIGYPGPTARIVYLRALEGAASRNGRADAIEHLARDFRGSYPDLRRAWATHRESGAKNSGYLRLIDPRSVFQRLHDRVMDRFGLEPEDLASKSQARRISHARQILAHICVREGLTQAEVGRYLGGRSRAAISYAVKALAGRMSLSREVRLQVESLL